MYDQTCVIRCPAQITHGEHTLNSAGRVHTFLVTSKPCQTLQKYKSFDFDQNKDTKNSRSHNFNSASLIPMIYYAKVYD